LQIVLRLPWGQIDFPPQSLQLFLRFPCGHKPLPPHSLHKLFFARPCGHFVEIPDGPDGPDFFFFLIVGLVLFDAFATFLEEAGAEAGSEAEAEAGAEAEAEGVEKGISLRLANCFVLTIFICKLSNKNNKF